MKFFTKKGFLFKLIVCLCIFLALINIGGTQRVYAKGDKGEQGRNVDETYL